MRSSVRILLLGVLMLTVTVSCKETTKTEVQEVDTYVADNYTKKEVAYL